MQIHTDDEVYRVDAVWLGPPNATTPWRARYVAWGIGGVLLLLVLTAERAVGIGFGFFSTAWALLVTIVLTRWIGRKINHERPLTAVGQLLAHELRTPRETTTCTGGPVTTRAVRIARDRPRPRPRPPHRPPVPPPQPRAAPPASTTREA